MSCRPESGSSPGWGTMTGAQIPGTSPRPTPTPGEVWLSLNSFLGPAFPPGSSLLGPLATPAPGEVWLSYPSWIHPALPVSNLLSWFQPSLSLQVPAFPPGSSLPSRFQPSLQAPAFPSGSSLLFWFQPSLFSSGSSFPFLFQPSLPSWFQPSLLVPASSPCSSLNALLVPAFPSGLILPSWFRPSLVVPALIPSWFQPSLLVLSFPPGSSLNALLVPAFWVPSPPQLQVRLGSALNSATVSATGSAPRRPSAPFWTRPGRTRRACPLTPSSSVDDVPWVCRSSTSPSAGNTASSSGRP